MSLADVDFFVALKGTLVYLFTELRHFLYIALGEKTGLSSKLHDFSFILESTLPLLLQSTYLEFHILTMP